MEGGRLNAESKVHSVKAMQMVEDYIRIRNCELFDCGYRILDWGLQHHDRSELKKKEGLRQRINRHVERFKITLPYAPCALSHAFTSPRPALFKSIISSGFELSALSYQLARNVLPRTNKSIVSSGYELSALSYQLAPIVHSRNLAP